MARIVLILAFIVSFAAGLIIGRELKVEAKAAPASRPSGRGGFLTAELNLTPDQQEQMKKIWSDTVRRGGREQEDRRRQFRKERDDAVLALLGEDRREQYEQIQKAYMDKYAVMEKEMRSSFQAAVEKTKQILTPEQRGKYEEILKRQEAERAQREQERRADTRATSRPATTQTSSGVAPR